jgi:hypothetical protein
LAREAVGLERGLGLGGAATWRGGIWVREEVDLERGLGLGRVEFGLEEELGSRESWLGDGRVESGLKLEGGLIGQGPREREPPLPQIVPCRHPVGCYWDSPRPECNGSSLSQAIRLLDHRLTPAR